MVGAPKPPPVLPQPGQTHRPSLLGTPGNNPGPSGLGSGNYAPAPSNYGGKFRRFVVTKRRIHDVHVHGPPVHVHVDLYMSFLPPPPPSLSPASSPPPPVSVVDPYAAGGSLQIGVKRTYQEMAVSDE